MINKERYLDVLSQVLNEYYAAINRKDAGSAGLQHYIDGYLTAAKALDVVSTGELKKVIDKVHFNAFGKTIEERKQSEISQYTSNNENLEIPTYIREGIILETE